MCVYICICTLSRALLLQLFFPDGFSLAARAAFCAAVQTVIFVGCCYPMTSGSVINMHRGSPSRSAGPTMSRLLDLLS